MPKRKQPSDNSNTKKRKTITLREKMDIINRHEKGEKAAAIGRAVGLGRTTVASIIHDKERIMANVKGATPLNSTVITKQRSGVLVEMERLLMMWIEDNNQRCMPLSERLICEKARSLYEDLKKDSDDGGDNEGVNESFLASKGWFNRFKVRANLNNRKLYGEVASADDDGEG